MITDETFRLPNKREAVWLKINKILEIYSGGASPLLMINLREIRKRGDSQEAD